MRPIVVVEFLLNGGVVFRGSCSPKDEEHYIQVTRKQFSIPRMYPIKLTLFEWVSEYGQYYIPQKVRTWMI